ncbi:MULTISPECIES: elongation factor P maturation arginine rhamnosyltransferase EarP [unclassified Polaromonas]|uniref:elongation factor P maturation arginine rhamnosyltransferase EarP n=1 Tax=unclassified Polaromonas TaxID=2638319 RepID=UPI000F07ABA6|nr:MULTISPECIES: elongation factor P maturation arginine rhamnosyltransferase EarP [unclassified Polaromonas]AYQ29166.1 elongation factor P maturation arginine rhamnosyltransferase EarP [Polaromonas sp. SP1]QGJ19719.1 elongation factor P maturation arginine rhamnosyltransferase EarP [Polaromonas sp. Pch-P]
MNRRQWDIFCKVIDNFGDIGVCWRLACDLAARGHSVRLWVDDAAALAWMAPAGSEGVQVLPWPRDGTPLDLQAAGFAQQPPDVLVEAFGCEIAPEFIAACASSMRATGLKPVWINLEYLSAEAYVERYHAMPSPVQSGPAAGWTKWFFYPGFTAHTGGLLREPGLQERQARFDRAGWLKAQNIPWRGETLVSLFCYEPPALEALLAQLSRHGLQGNPVRLLVAAGRAAHAVRAIVEGEKGLQPIQDKGSLLSISYLPLLEQAGFDHLLWASDLNFVRGEDSLVRALWAGRPFVWQIYPQHDDAHLAKLQAFLDMLQAPPSLRAFHAAWNGKTAPAPAAGGLGPMLADWPAWQAAALAARGRLTAQDDLVSRLLGFVAKKR